MHVTLAMTGTSPLVMHNARLIDPEDEFVKQIGEITSKRKKTEADRAEVERLEFLGGVYFDQDVGIHLPTSNVVRCLEEAGKVTRMGTAIVRGVSVQTDRAPLVYDGPRKLLDLWAQPQFRFRKAVGIGRSRIIRVRPIFRRWAVSLDLMVLEEVMDLDEFVRIADLAGRAIGVGDARKLGYGRFSIDVSVQEAAHAA